MGAFSRRVLPALLLALAAGIAARAAAPDLQTSLRDSFFSTLKPEQQKGLTKSSPIDQMIGKMDLQQRQRAAGQLPALESQFSDPASLSEIGSVYLKLGDFSAATRIAEALKEKYPEDPRVLLLEAKAKADSGDKEGALAAAKQAVTVDPGNGEAFTFFKLLRGGGTQSSQIPLQATRAAAAATRDPGRNPTMGERQLERVNNALAILMTSPNGKRILLAVVPNAGGSVTEADLDKHGIRLQMSQEKQVGRNFGSVSSTTVKGRGQVTVIGFNAAVLDERNDVREMAGFFGGKIDQAAYQDKTGWHLPPILLAWRERVVDAVILIDLKVEAFATRMSSDFSQEMRLNARVMEGNVGQKKNHDSSEEFFGEMFETGRKTLVGSESNFGVKGIGLICLLNGLMNNNQTDIQLSREYPDYANQKKSVSADLRRDFENH